MLEALTAYESRFAVCTWQRINVGFSGAIVYAGTWLGESTPFYALKLWSIEDKQRIEEAHSVQRAFHNSLEVVPDLIENRQGSTLTIVGKRCWEISEWRPGQPMEIPTKNRIEAAASAIAALHQSHQFKTQQDRLNERVAYVNAAIDRLHVLALPVWLRALADLLKPIRSPIPAANPRNIQWIHGDLHREHMLFLGNSVTGIIDFTNTKVDHPAIDLARYLGDTLDDSSLLEPAVAAYRLAGGAVDVTVDLVRYFCHVIASGALAHWIEQWATGKISADRQSDLRQRMEHLGGQVIRFSS